jgi:hypothetical protein
MEVSGTARVLGQSIANIGAVTSTFLSFFSPPKKMFSPCVAGGRRSVFQLV